MARQGRIAFQFSEGYVVPVWPAQQDAQRITMHLDLEVEDLPSAVVRVGNSPLSHTHRRPHPTASTVLTRDGHRACAGSGHDGLLSVRTTMLL